MSGSGTLGGQQSTGPNHGKDRCSSTRVLHTPNWFTKYECYLSLGSCKSYKICPLIKGKWHLIKMYGKRTCGITTTKLAAKYSFFSSSRDLFSIVSCYLNPFAFPRWHKFFNCGSPLPNSRSKYDLLYSLKKTSITKKKHHSL